MSEEFDFIGPNDLPSLLAITQPDAAAIAKSTLQEMGYKVHTVDSHIQFETRYNQINYQVVIVEDVFAESQPSENPSLQFLQALPMSQRRYAVIFLVGGSLETLNTLQAFAHSVHCVVNYTELPMLGQLLQKTIAENNLFLSTFREVQERLIHKGD
jgi:DNA-binding NtrC family response regulator